MKQMVIPYYNNIEHDQLKRLGVEVVTVDGATIAHIKECGAELEREMKNPCRLDAVVLLLCVKGEISFSSHMCKYRLKAGDMVVGAISIMQFESVADSEFYMLVYKREFMTKMNLDVRFMADMVATLRNSSNVYGVEEPELKTLCSSFNLLFEGYGEQFAKDYRTLALSHAFSSIFYRIYDIISAKGRANTSCGGRDRATELFERLVQLISEHYREQRSVEFYAEQMNISSKHLSRVVGNTTGKSVHHWIDEFVVLEIKNLLKYSDMSVQQISYALNFPNPSFMGQYFKRITGMTPGEYKRS